MNGSDGGTTALASGAGGTALAEQVLRRLLQLIRDGVLRPGQALPSERELAETMRVGRPSLREALRALAVLGIVDIRNREGVFVRDLDLGGLLEPLRIHLSLDRRLLDDLFEARVVFESGLAELAAERADGADLAALRGCLERGGVAIHDPAAFQLVDDEFHERIAAVAANTFLLRIAQSVWEFVRASRQITLRLPGVPRRSQEDHQRILAAFERRDGAAAGQAMREHIRNVQAAYHLAKGITW